MCLRTFIKNQSSESIKSFSSDVLSKFWGEFHIFVWECNKPFTSFQGNELAAFIQHIPHIISFLIEEFGETEHLRNLQKMLDLWMKISHFLRITYVDDVEIYKLQISILEDNVKLFYNVGKDTFLTTNSEGDSETFYMHVLRFYIPHIAKITIDKHEVGVGVFSMQGYERRNRESKNCFKRFNNKKGNIVTQNMKRMWDIFNYERNSF